MVTALGERVKKTCVQICCLDFVTFETFETLETFETFLRC